VDSLRLAPGRASRYQRGGISFFVGVAVSHRVIF
jgi:hypothetical protein